MFRDLVFLGGPDSFQDPGRHCSGLHVILRGYRADRIAAADKRFDRISRRGL
jgi:hypothetical protein